MLKCIIATMYLTTELAHSKLKCGCFIRVISCHDRWAKKSVRIRARSLEMCPAYTDTSV